MREATPPQDPPTGPRSRRHTQPLVQKENEDLARQLRAAQKNAKQLEKQLKDSQQGHRPRGTANRRMSDSDDEAADIESQDEADQAGSCRSGGGFTSAIQSRGIVETSRPPAPRKLYREGRPPQTEVLPFRPVANIELRYGEEQPHPSSRFHRPDKALAVSPVKDYGNHAMDHDAIGESGHVGHGVPVSPSPSQGDGYWNDDIALASVHSLSSRKRPHSPDPRSSSPIAASSTVVSQSSSPAPKRKKLAPAPFRRDAKVGRVPKAADYEEGVQQLILTAAHEYGCFIIGTAALPNPTLSSETAQKIWSRTCAKVDEAYQMDARILKLITARGSWARGIIKDAAVRHFPTFYHFKKGKSEATKDFNKDLRHSLLKGDAFHHKDIQALTGFAQGKIITDILETAFFEDATGLGVQFRQYFRPISENTLALVITALEFLLDDYISGEQDRGRKFEEKLIKPTFDKHLARANDWTILNPTVTQNIRMKLFKRLMVRAGATDIDKPVEGLSTVARDTMKAELEAHTGDTDSENEE